MKKYLLALLVVLGTWSLTPVVFVASTVATMKIVCYLNRCERQISSDDPVPSPFTVMVRVPAKGNRVEPVLLPDLGKFVENNREATLHLLVDKGATDDESWEYSATRDAAGLQIVEAHTLEGGRIDVRYKASHQSAQALNLNVVSPGILFFSMPIAGVFTWIFLMLVRRVRLWKVK
ncbi:hypothetical protein RBA41_18700 [Massilia sp. CCM 9210]|uniref:hypothetical protein n=1 Tax=Massilia scottii TaxID=3057166 RepID=UPI0027966C6C|nr:hypothetical protein [Massilia sp. CCM 9210]MDQ1815334.1 hypothetical protein [Massilia sp. CCM 9210]